MTKEKSIQFYRSDGAGNRFLISFDQISFEGIQKKTDFIPWVQNVCLQGAWKCDGLLFVTEIEKNKLKWDFYNADGSTAEMCGNAARCVADLLPLSQGQRVELVTNAGSVFLANENGPQVLMPAIRVIKKNIQIQLNKKTIEGQFVDSGVPHFVVDERNIEKSDQLASDLRHHPLMGNGGANVTWKRKISSDHVRAVTFERGVEGFTPSCGTGAVAAAWVENDGRTQDIFVEMPGGTLRVSFLENGIWLSGPVKIFGTETVVWESE